MPTGIFLVRKVEQGVECVQGIGASLDL